MLLRYLVVHHPCCCASCFHFRSRAHQLCFQLQMLLRYHVCCNLCCCASCFSLQSLVLHFQQECFLLLQLLRYFLHRFLCHVCFFFFFGGGFFYRDDNILIPFLELGHFNVVFLGFSSCSAYTVVSCFVFPLLTLIFFSGMLIKRVAVTHLGHFPCESCRWPQRPSHSSGIFSWSKCSRFVFPSLSERRRTSVSAAFF